MFKLLNICCVIVLTPLITRKTVPNCKVLRRSFKSTAHFISIGLLHLSSGKWLF